MCCTKPAKPAEVKKDLSDAEDFEQVAIPPAEDDNEAIEDQESEEDCDLVEDCQESVEKQLSFLEDTLAKTLLENERLRKQKTQLKMFSLITMSLLIGGFAITVSAPARPHPYLPSPPKPETPQCPACPELVVPSCLVTYLEQKQRIDEFMHHLGVEIVDRFISWVRGLRFEKKSIVEAGLFAGFFTLAVYAVFSYIRVLWIISNRLSDRTMKRLDKVFGKETSSKEAKPEASASNKNVKVEEKAEPAVEECEKTVEPTFSRAKEAVEPKEEVQTAFMSANQMEALEELIARKTLTHVEELARLQEQIDDIKKSLRTETSI